MREIKFRCWDREYLNWLSTDVVDLVFEPDSSVTGVVGNSIVELMQYTGLKDKNGKEIYEGDIIRYHHPDKRLKNHPQICTVVYKPEAAAFLLMQNHYEPAVKYLGDIAKAGKDYETRTYELCEIIGNIHENPAPSAPSPDKASK